jgi:aspartyl-tRNA(Asn)/glutamyl-tRNA(Gln) amidotransferase subunit A
MSGWDSIEHIGPITRTVADAALMMSAAAGPDMSDRLSLPKADFDLDGLPEGLFAPNASRGLSKISPTPT